MKIVHAVYSMEMGGAEMLVAQLARLQKANGHEVAITAYSKLGALGEMLRSEGIQVHVLGEAHPAITMLRYWKLFRKMKPDVVHTHNPAPTLQAAPGARLSGAKSVIATRHSLVAPPYNRAEEIKFSVFSHLWLDWVTGICEITCKNLRGAPGARRSRIVRVYNGVTPIDDAKPAHMANEFRLLFVGRLAEIKSLPTLIRAVAIASETIPHIRLTIVGDGPVRQGLENLVDELQIRNNVRFEGQQLQTEPYFREAAVFTMSSVSEGLPMSLLQAMSAGLPAVLTEVGGMREILELSQSGVLVPVGGSKEMADAFVRLAADKDLRKVYATRARGTFQQEFTLEQMELAYMRLYTSGER